MPLSRYLVRNEYGLADPDLYRAADKDDPEALLEGVAMAGLVGVLRQLGDLAEFAAEMFHDLHEEVMGTAARGHALIARVQQLEAEFPSAEKTLLSQTSHIPFLYSSGIDWHPSIRMDEDLVTQGDMPRFVMDSYEECRGPPRLFLLDKFDVAGAGACLKRYTDPSFFKAESAEFSIKKSEGQREKRVRKVKRRGSQWRNGGTAEGFPSSHAKLHQLLLEERIETGANDPERRVKLKKRQLDGFKREDKLKSYMQKFMDTCSSDNKVVHEISLDLVPINFESNCDTCQSGLEIVEIDTFSPSREPFYRDKAAYSSFNIPEVVKPSVHELNEVIDGRTVEIPGAHYEADADNLSLCNKDVTNEELAADTGSKSGGSVGEYNVDDVASETDNYVDALATMESETETDSDYRTKRDRRYLNSSEEKQRQNTFLDYHSVGNSTISDDGSLLKKDIDSFSCSDNVSNFAEDATGEPTAKSFTAGPVSPLADDEKVITMEAQGTEIEECIASDDAESMGKNPLLQSDKFKELPWISVNAGTALTKKGNEGMEKTDQESKEQLVAHAVPNDGYDHLMSVGISPVDEKAGTSSDSSFDVSLGHSHMPEETSSHPQSEYARDSESTLFIEMKSDSSASSPARKPIHDLSQPAEATSDGLPVPQKPFVSVLNYPKPVYVPCEDNDSTPIAEEKSEDQSRLSGIVQDHKQPKGHVAEAPYVCMPNQFDSSEDVLQCSENETNIRMVSLAADDSELVEPMISVASDVDGIVEPRVSTASNTEDFSALIADHADRDSQALEIHYPLEPRCFEGSESTGRLEFDTSENEVAHFVDESSGFTVCESTGEKTNMNGEDSCNLILNAPVLFDGQMAEAGDSACATVADTEGLSESISLDKGESHLCLDQPGPAPVSSSPACLVYDASEQAEGDTISFDDITHGKDAAISSETISSDSRYEHLPEEKNDLDLDHSVQVANQAESNCLQFENTKTERQSLSSVFDFSSTWYEESISIGEDPYQNSEGSQAERDLQIPVSCGRDECVNSDSIVCDTSTVLGLADNVPETCLSEGSQTSLSLTSPEEAPLFSIECDQHLERANSSHYHAVEGEEHIVDAFENVNTQTQIALNKTIETRGVEMTAESFNATEGTSQPLKYVEQILPPEDGGNETCINPIPASSLCAPLSQPVVSDLSVQSGDYKVESPLVEGEPSAFSVSVSPPREPLLAEASAPSADHKLQSTWKAREQSPADFSSNSVRPAEAQARLKVENPGNTKDLSHVNLPLFGTSPNPTHIKQGEMPPLPPLPPIQWRLGRNQHTSLVSEGLMQHPFGTRQRLDHSETSDNVGLRSQNYLGAQHLNPFLSLSDEGANIHHVTGYSDSYVQQPTDSMFSMPNTSHEDGQQSISLDQRQDAQIFTGSQDDLLVPASDARMDKFSLELLGSGLVIDDSTPETPALFQTETTVAHEYIFSPAEQETTGVDEQLEYKEEKEIATTSAQFEPPLAMQYGHQLSRGFVAPEAQGMWSTDEFGTIKPENVNGSLQKKIQRPRNPLIDAVVAVDKSKLRKVGEIVKPQDQPEAEKREQHLPQLRKVGERVKLLDAVEDEERFQNFPPLRKIGERVKPHDLPSTEDSVQHLPQLRKVEERIKAQDEPKAEDEEQGFLPLRVVGGRLKPQDGPQPENKDWLEQIRNQSFNLKRPTTSRPSIQGRQTNLRVSAILEKANMIRQAIAGNDEDDSDGWSDS